MSDHSQNHQGFYASRIGVDEERRTLVAVGGSLLIGTVIAILIIASTAHGQEPAPVYLDVYAAPRGTGPTAMEPKLKIGPFPDVVICYSVGALSIDALNAANPHRDFMARCGDGDLLTLRGMTDAATALLPRPYAD